MRLLVKPHYDEAISDDVFEMQDRAPISLQEIDWAGREEEGWCRLSPAKLCRSVDRTEDAPSRLARSAPPLRGCRS